MLAVMTVMAEMVMVMVVVEMVIICCIFKAVKGSARRGNCMCYSLEA